MAANRASSMRILRAILADTKPAVPTKRALHITGVRNSPAFSPTGQKETIASFNRKSIPDLKQECYKRTLNTSGSKHELIERLVNHDALQSRAFSIAMKRVIKDNSGPTRSSSVDRTPSRQFNTSRINKAVNDNSTIDFAYLPEMAAESDGVAQSIRVPVAPDAYGVAPSQTIVHSTGAPIDSELDVMKPQVYTIGDPDGDIVNTNGSPIVSTLQDVVDNNGVAMDPYTLTETVTRAAQKISSKVESEVDEKSTGLKQVWSGFMDDLLGEKKKVAP